MKLNSTSKNNSRKKPEGRFLSSEFISTASHELRAPLATIREGLSQVSAGSLGMLNRKQKVMMRLVLDEVDRLYGLVNDLLDVSRMEAGRTALHKTLFDLPEMIRRHLQGFRHLLAKKEIALNLSFPSETLIAFADTSKIAQVLTNLISNAYKFTPKYGKIEIEVRKHSSEIIIGISDTGIGIRKEDIPHLFDRFSQFSPAMQTDLKGTGLGLAISKGLVELHQGRLWAESEVGRGSKFYFALPLLSDEEVSRECVEAGINEAALHQSPMSLFVIKFENEEKAKVPLNPINSRILLKNLEEHLSGIFKESIAAAFNEKSEYILMLPGADRANALDYERKFKFLISGFIERVKKKYGVKLRVKLGLSMYPEEGKTGDKLLLKARISVRELVLTSEHRKKPRKNFQFNVDFVPVQPGSGAEYQTIDVSEGGLCLNSSQNLIVGSTHSVLFQLPGHAKKIQAKVIVRWVEQVDGVPGYKVGLQFSAFSKLSKRTLKEFLNQKISLDRS